MREFERRHKAERQRTKALCNAADRVAALRHSGLRHCIPDDRVGALRHSGLRHFISRLRG